MMMSIFHVAKRHVFLVMVSLLAITSLYASFTATEERKLGFDVPSLESFSQHHINHTSIESANSFTIHVTNSTRPLPLPIQVMQDYIREHSVDALRADAHLERRNYSLAFYQCPKSVGNNLHKFWNHVLWAMLTNRTVLWQYWNRDLCETYGLYQCVESNTESDCAKVLTRAPWMASYDDWKDKIRVGSNETVKPFLVPDHVTRGPDVLPNPRPDNYKADFGVDLASKYPYQILMFPLCFYKFRHLATSEFQTTLLQTEHGRATAQSLYSLGSEFLYGMLHRYTFRLPESMTSAALPTTTIPDNGNSNSNSDYTVALHSRHEVDELDGCNIDREITCLEHILGGRRNGTVQPVQVRIMADRTCTISNLTQWLQERNHSVEMAKHEEVSFDALSEHGPHAGEGFFRDVAVVSASRSAFIGKRRSSSDLVRELIVFDRAMELWNMGVELKGDMRRVVDTCLLDAIPTFVPAIPFPPIKIE